MYVMELSNGIGDQLLDYIGLSVLSYIDNTSYSVIWKQKERNFIWGNCLYPYSLFSIPHVITDPKQLDDIKDKTYIKAKNPSYSLSPYMICKLRETVDEKIIIDLFKKNAKLISPSNELSDFLDRSLPNSIYNTYGIHLRGTDKIVQTSTFIDVSITEHSCIIQKLKHYIKNIIDNEDKPSFYIASEDDFIKKEFTIWLNTYDKVTIIQQPHVYSYTQSNDFNYNNNTKAIIDLFTLSRCKCLISGTKYSTYGLLACLISKYSQYICFDNEMEKSLLNHWIDCVNTITHNNTSLRDRKTFDTTNLKFTIEPFKICYNI